MKTTTDISTTTLTAPLLVGAASRDITPDLPAPRGGGGVGGLAAVYTSEIHSPLTAQSVAWGNEDEVIIWTSCDLGGVENEFAAEFRGNVSKATGLPEHRINISATHSHGGPSGPKFSLYHTESLENESRAVFRTMFDKAAQSAVAAFSNRQPAKMGYGSGRVQRACFNRRFIMSNGRVRMHGKTSPGVERLQAEGPVDDEVQVVWFEHRETGEPIAILVNMASHPNQMYGNKALGSEYPGVMRETVSRALGRDIPIVFLQGACGNIQTVDIEGNAKWGGGVEGIHTVGTMLGGEVIKLLHSSKARDTTGMLLACASGSVELAYRDFPAEEVEHVLRVVREGKQSGDLKAHLDNHFPDLEQKARAKQVVLIDSLKQKSDADVLEIGGIRLGDIVFITTPAHHFVEYQIALKKAFPGKRVLLADLTNGSANYIATRLGIALGGYETEHQRYEPAAGEKILAASKALAGRLWNK